MKKVISKEPGFKHFCVFNTPWIGIGMSMSPLSRINDGLNDITFLSQTMGSCTLLKFMLMMDDGKAYFNSDKKSNKYG